MPRRPRLELPDIPLHVTHRGVNRAATFIDDEDASHYLQWLRDALAAQQVQLHAYVLMTNHVHMLLTQPAAGRLSKAMCHLGQRYVPWFNRKHGRTGTLWEGRFKSCLVDSDHYLLQVYRYIELNPVRAGMVVRPEDHPWSSVHANLGMHPDALVTPHPGWLVLGQTSAIRATAYRDWLEAGTDADTTAAIRAHMQQERALGAPRFQAMVERSLNRPVAVRQRGRPRGGVSGVQTEIQTEIYSGPF